jgi:hypothetical protein
VTNDEVARIAVLLRDRNAIDDQIAAITGRPMVSGHLGEWIAAQVFDITLEDSAVTAAIDGRFRSGPLNGRTVNVKWYLKQEGLLDITEASILDYYLVMTGPRSAALSSKYGIRPWRIDSVYLFNAAELLTQQRDRRVKIGVASSVLASQWRAAEIYPEPRNPALPLSERQIDLLRLFRPA